MIILFVSAANSTHTVRWVNALAERGHKVHLAYNEGHEEKEDKLLETVICHPLKYGGGKGYYLNARELRGICKKINPDVINAHYASGYGTLVRRAKIAPVLLSVWGSDVYDFPQEGYFQKKIFCKNISYADMLASTSKCMGEQLQRVIGKKCEIHITPFGVDLDKFSCSEREAHNEIYIGNVKTLKPLYGIDDLIQATAILKKDLEQEVFNKIQVEIYGDGPQREELNALICKLNLNEHVKLMGKISNEEVPRVINKWDIFCATSHKESFGVSLVEAMAMECPVVCTDAEGFKEVVEDNVSGFIVPKGKPEKIAKALTIFIENRDMRIGFGKAGRKRVQNKFNWEKNVTKMEHLYQELSTLKR